MNDSRVITKVKCKDGKITVHYEVRRADREDRDKFTLESWDQAKPEFYSYFDLLKNSVIEICELPVHFIDRVQVIGVSFSWTEDIMGATITALLSLKNSNAPLVINTPHKPEAPYSEGSDDSNVLPDDAIRDLTSLMAAAKRYIDGERSTIQSDLFKQDKKEAVTA